MSEHITIQYAHCVKWTDGQLDRAPHSVYELREANATLDEWLSYEDGPQFGVRAQGGRIIGDGDTAQEAIAQAEYWLMNQSREQLQVATA